MFIIYIHRDLLKPWLADKKHALWPKVINLAKIIMHDKYSNFYNTGNRAQQKLLHCSTSKAKVHLRNSSCVMEVKEVPRLQCCVRFWRSRLGVALPITTWVKISIIVQLLCASQLWNYIPVICRTFSFVQLNSLSAVTRLYAFAFRYTVVMFFSFMLKKKLYHMVANWYFYW